MKKKAILGQILSLAICAGLMMSTVAFAAEPPEAEPTAAAHEGTIQVLRMLNDSPLSDVGVSIYRVADQVQGHLQWTEEYADYQLTLKPEDEESYSNLPQNLLSLILRDNKTATASAKTGEDGKVLFEGLEDGVYLITGDRYTSGGYYYDLIPFLVFLPYLPDDQVADRHIEIEAKNEATRIPPPSTVSRHVLKVWDDLDNEQSRPDSVNVQLLNNGVVVDTQTLSEANDWRFTWTNLSRNGNWSVVEVDVPENYSFSVRGEGVTFVITNTYEEELDDPDTPEIDKPDVSETPSPDVTPVPSVEPSVAPSEAPENPDKTDDINTPGLPQTGQPWVPVILCSGAGIAFILAGLIMKRKEQNNAENG